jgi:hypothetical protein
MCLNVRRTERTTISLSRNVRDARPGNQAGLRHPQIQETSFVDLASLPERRIFGKPEVTSKLPHLTPIASPSSCRPVDARFNALKIQQEFRLHGDPGAILDQKMGQILFRARLSHPIIYF